MSEQDATNQVKPEKGLETEGPFPVSPKAQPPETDALGSGGFNVQVGKKRENHPFAKNLEGSDKSFGLARYLAWVSLALVLGLAVLLAFTTGNVARGLLLDKQRESAALLAENLNNRIYQRFTLPTMAIFGRIVLELPAQYERLDQVIQSNIQGQDVHDLRIYDHTGTINYATEKGLAGQAGLAPQAVDKVKNGIDPVFDIDTPLSYWETFFAFNPPKGTFYLRTTYPLRIENRLGSSTDEGPAMGVLEFTQDITADMRSVVHLQWTIIGFTLLFSLLFVTLLTVFMRRAERALAARVQERQRLIQELNQSERLAGMGRVISGIAHEIRNPLGIIRSSAELLLKRNAGQDKVTSNILAAIHDESKRLSQTVTDFLDYARPRQPHCSSVNMNQLLEQALGFLAPELSAKGCAVARRYDPEEPALNIQGDKDLLYRAIYNVLSNALQAMTEAGTVSPEIVFEARGLEVKGRDFLKFSISDSGPGFKEEALEKALDPFFTTKDSGTGLGLAIVSSIIGAHGGILEFSNRAEGSGAVITILLPR